MRQIAGSLTGAAATMRPRELVPRGLITVSLLFALGATVLAQAVIAINLTLA
jgi:hypothetical protein